jgi:pyruvate/2-oxoglutarate dehydrogenase complex dihydrolipoamide dehydrogenase (E3) component
VRHDKRDGVAVNDRLQTTNRNIYAAGDVYSRFKLTHAADGMVCIGLQNALFKGQASTSALTIPWCTYTDQKIATSAYENEARGRAVAFRIFTQELADVDRAVLDGEDDGFVKVLVSPRGDKILGPPSSPRTRAT